MCFLTIHNTHIASSLSLNSPIYERSPSFTSCWCSTFQKVSAKTQLWTSALSEHRGLNMLLYARLLPGVNCEKYRSENGYSMGPLKGWHLPHVSVTHCISWVNFVKWLDSVKTTVSLTTYDGWREKCVVRTVCVLIAGWHLKHAVM